MSAIGKEGERGRVFARKLQEIGPQRLRGGERPGKVGGRVLDADDRRAVSTFIELILGAHVKKVAPKLLKPRKDA